MPLPTLHVRILSSKETIFEGDALSVSSTNSAGKFDILPEHAHFVSFIDKQSIIVQTLTKEVKKFDLPLALIYFIDNTVNIYTITE